MAEALLLIVLENLNTFILRKIGLLWGLHKEMKKLSITLTAIKGVLEDAELKQLQDKSIKIWLRKLKQAAYDIDDVLDECATEAARLESKGQNLGSLHKVRSCFLTCYYPVDNVLFRYKVGNRMKEVIENLDSIAEERRNFRLDVAVVSPNRAGIPEWRETSSFVTETQVYGRANDKEIIVEVLVKHASDCHDVSVLPILGIGGLGKTTLAQLVFNDERVVEHFEMRIWVCVSEDFEIKRVIKSILASMSGNSCEDLELDNLHRLLQDKLNGKKYLLVLDDVWNDNQEKWDKLKCVLAFGSRGASVVITTRLGNVASIMGTLPPYRLLGLTEDDCWSLFKQRAFGHEGEERPDLEEIGKEIVRKCGGVPLAAKALGSLLRFKKEKSGWLRVKDSEIWNLPQDEKCPIMPALRLSYHNLPLECRQCFAYCAIFEKDSRIERDRVIHLWMATGCIFSNGTPEDIGNEIWNELHWRSFFQEVENDRFGNIESFKMHDLVHDLAQSIMEDECHVMKVERPEHMPNRSTRHLISVHDSKVLENVESLRTLFVNVFSLNVMKFNTLRVLDASETCISELPSSIGNLIHLRYLNLSKNDFITLPDTICNLLNLQTLNLEYCGSLERLPKYMRRLTNLRHLFLKGCFCLTQTAPKIGQLTSLKTLSRFIVDGRTGCHLGELRGLNIGGILLIKCLERVENWMDAREANLIEKQNIYSLFLYWTFEVESESSLAENAERVLDALEPHPNIKELIIDNYPGTSFPLWMREPVLENLVSVKLFGCKNCQNLPSFGRLRFLKELTIGWMKDVKYIDNDDSGHGGAAGMKFPSLERLDIYGLSSLERLSREEEKDVVLFPRLSFLDIKDCPQLTLPCLLSLNHLRAWGCSDVLLNSISNLPRLSILEIQRNHQQLSYLEGSLQNLTALNSLHIYGCRDAEQGLQRLLSFGFRGINESWSEAKQSFQALDASTVEGCPKLVSPPEDCINCKHLHSLRRLVFSDNLNLEDLPEALQHLPALQSLHIINNKELKSLPEWLGNLASIQKLSIWRCPKVGSLSDTIQSLTNLTTLVISECGDQLKRRCEKGTGEDWHKIAHIPYVRIKDELRTSS
ncbi:putative disease resistance protein RGA3 [Cornus florida]|uniref:putative disease resistance protein RGA3 n=1 Tax=Cornus florida TaxID=4283 RepID=UPI0028A24C72|nr:putative disease resistance protein RGA3 [Cornus florida]